MEEGTSTFKYQRSNALYSVQRQISDGNLQVVTVKIPYEDKSTIHVLVDDVQISSGTVQGSPYTWRWDSDTIRISPRVASGSQVLVRRVSPADSMKNIFNGQAEFTDQSMDENFKQLLWLAQEYGEGSGIHDVFSNINMHGYKITNVGRATDEGDVITFQQYKQDSQGLWNAVKNAQEAERSASASADYANTSSLKAQQEADRAYSQAQRAKQYADRVQFPQVQADWNTEDPEDKSYIKNKPTTFPPSPIIATGSSIARRLQDRFNDIVNVKDFGAVGDGVADDTEAIKSAIEVAKGKRIVFYSNEKYRITSSITTTYALVSSDPINIIVDFIPKDQYDKAIDLNGTGNSIEEINIYVKGDNQFNTVIHAGDGKYGKVHIDAEIFSSIKPTFAAAGAFNVYKDNNVSVDELNVNNFWYATYFGRSNGIRVNSLTATNTIRGAQFYLCNDVFVDYFRVESSLNLIDWEGDFNNASGANGIVIQACKNLTVNSFTSSNTISHAIRISPETDYDTENITFGTVVIQGSGRQGVKCCGSTVDSEGSFTGTPAWMRDITFGVIKILDVGGTSDKALTELGGNGQFSDYNAQGKIGGTNEYAVSLVRVRRCTIGALYVQKQVNNYASCSVGLYINSCTNVLVAKAYLYDCYYYGIEIKEGYGDTNHIDVSATVCRVGTMSDNTTSGSSIASKNTRGYGVYIHDDVEDLASVNLSVFLNDVRRAIRHNLQNIAGPVVINGYSCRNYVLEEGPTIESSLYLNDITQVFPRV